MDAGRPDEPPDRLAPHAPEDQEVELVVEIHELLRVAVEHREILLLQVRAQGDHCLGAEGDARARDDLLLDAEAQKAGLLDEDGVDLRHVAPLLRQDVDEMVPVQADERLAHRRPAQSERIPDGLFRDGHPRREHESDQIVEQRPVDPSARGFPVFARDGEESVHPRIGPLSTRHRRDSAGTAKSTGRTPGSRLRSESR
ncbi:hypothetical protein SDC9_187878 [bioreactor metagenome]|uniref:Uncharacterized protein n=1 Tax=bioreactor metagenome TaxID=1076179 RepID=A0A645HPF0_9ZZZZ